MLFLLGGTRNASEASVERGSPDFQGEEGRLEGRLPSGLHSAGTFRQLTLQPFISLFIYGNGMFVLDKQAR